MKKRKTRRPPAVPAGRSWELAYGAIKERILNMSLKPGEMVSELTVSKELGISRTPIREALKKLEQEGLIVDHNRRKRVYILTIHEINEIFDLKVAIEGHMAALAALRHDAGQAARLRAIMKTMEGFRVRDYSGAKADHPIIQDWLKVDRQFHDLLFAMAGAGRAAELVDNLNSQWHRLRMGLLAMEDRLRRNLDEHAALGEAVLARREEQARALMTAHLENLRHTLTALMQVFHFPI